MENNGFKYIRMAKKGSLIYTYFNFTFLSIFNLQYKKASIPLLVNTNFISWGEIVYRCKLLPTDK